MIVSLSEDEKAVQLVDQLLGEEEKLTGLWRSGSQESLRCPWKEFQPKAINILNETQPVIQSIQVLSAIGRHKQTVWEKHLRLAEESLQRATELCNRPFENGIAFAFSDASGGNGF